MEKLHKTLVLVAYSAFILLIIHDFFPGLALFDIFNSGLFIAFILIALVVSIIFRGKFKGERAFSFTWSLIGHLVVFLLIGTLMMLGGSSTVGIGLDNPVMWILFILSLGTLFNQYKKSRKVDHIYAE
ncbi:hypothetical protein BpOF4_21724 (plasmid) [Alkalihalophilus pseudofirmus OF4]|uniref:Uncharacterized protein n=1 Tax=Alkalihalophilus pseudofirmus (strain ATCC BAA-2126 / JCM 17055 / OF4) TaxID=398511 RepID=D3G1W4_ALKPO|nr:MULTISPECIES: hypothetical protein [Alkalihalophilus]ADC52340.1 hypothetical protein BpOF4_21724 [Alkalihalophilus pseudofirmus OF4]MED1602961.1 hypothetical protein [Alkalihalophilus marmarensis]